MPAPCKLQLGHGQLITGGALDGTCSAQLSWPKSKAWARHNPSGCPCAGIGSNCFSAQSRMAPTWG
eukprot:3383512-Alexandrium_andersonii.AAC.1